MRGPPPAPARPDAPPDSARPPLPPLSDGEGLEHDAKGSHTVARRIREVRVGGCIVTAFRAGPSNCLARAGIALFFGVTGDVGADTAAPTVSGRGTRRSSGCSVHLADSPPLFSGPGLEDIDVVIKCDGLRDFDSEYSGAVDVALVPGLIVKVLPIDRVLASKRAADRPKDRAVIPALKAAVAAIKESSQR